MNRSGLAGMDMLIMIVATLLAASVIAISFITTSNSLVMHDKEVATQGRKGMQKPIIIEQVRAVDTSGNQRINELIFQLRFHPSEEGFSFNETVVIANSKAVNCSSILYGLNSPENCSYTIRYLKQGTHFRQNHMHSGDFVEVKFTGPNLIEGMEDLDAKFIFIPNDVMVTSVIFDFPHRVYPPNFILWPLSD